MTKRAGEQVDMPEKIAKTEVDMPAKTDDMPAKTEVEIKNDTEDETKQEKEKPLVRAVKSAYPHFSEIKSNYHFELVSKSTPTSIGISKYTINIKFKDGNRFWYNIHSNDPQVWGQTPFGIDLSPSQPNCPVFLGGETKKEYVQFSVSLSEDALSFHRDLEENAFRFLAQNSNVLQGKQLSEEVIKSNFNSSIKEPKDPKYGPHLIMRMDMIASESIDRRAIIKVKRTNGEIVSGKGYEWWKSIFGNVSTRNWKCKVSVDASSMWQSGKSFGIRYRVMQAYLIEKFSEFESAYDF